jgi:hypothetical protein
MMRTNVTTRWRTPCSTAAWRLLRLPLTGALAGGIIYKEGDLELAIAQSKLSENG